MIFPRLQGLGIPHAPMSCQYQLTMDIHFYKRTGCEDTLIYIYITHSIYKLKLHES